ncbi:hypothetical protein MRBLMN1_003800 [Chitinophaga ginsengisegetis]|uniref:hypothetical protein n=1 Tax=Chitinophaga ginsengisegetis TaxID=393003 RepID=UPI0034183DEB
MGLIVFYEGNNATENIVQTVEDFSGQDFKPVPNNGIRSLRLYNVRPGCTIRASDLPDGSVNDDFCIINVKRDSPEYLVNLFERSYEDEFVVVTLIPSKGINGKVARVKIN